MDKKFEKEALRMCYTCQLSEQYHCIPLFEEQKFARCGGCGKVFCDNSGGVINENLCSECRLRIRENVSQDGKLLHGRLIRRNK